MRRSVVPPGSGLVQGREPFAGSYSLVTERCALLQAFSVVWLACLVCVGTVDSVPAPGTWLAGGVFDLRWWACVEQAFLLHP